jgi:hypothetical protein
LAGVSIDYYTRVERGRPAGPRLPAAPAKSTHANRNDALVKA